jgi:predicted nuclease with TOPRIM domain
MCQIAGAIQKVIGRLWGMSLRTSIGNAAETEDLAEQIQDMAASFVKVQSSLEKIRGLVSRFEEEYSSLDFTTPLPLPDDKSLPLPERLEEVMTQFISEVRRLQQDGQSGISGAYPDRDLQSQQDIEQLKSALDAAKEEHMRELQALHEQAEALKTASEDNHNLNIELNRLKAEKAQLQDQCQLLDEEKADLESRFRGDMESLEEKHQTELRQIEQELQGAVAGGDDIVASLQGILRVIERVLSGRAVTESNLTKRPRAARVQQMMPLERGSGLWGWILSIIVFGFIAVHVVHIRGQ